MKGYVLKRIITAIITMFLVVTAVFFVFRLGGADPVAIMMPPDASPADAEKLTRKFGLDQPLLNNSSFLNMQSEVTWASPSVTTNLRCAY